jgi:hypothetical protein
VAAPGPAHRSPAPRSPRSLVLAWAHALHSALFRLAAQDAGRRLGATAAESVGPDAPDQCDGPEACEGAPSEVFPLARRRPLVWWLSATTTF